MAQNLTAVVKASGTLTLDAVAANTETVTIAGKVYTFQTSLTDSDGNVLIGADAAASIVNLSRAIDLGAGSGTLYAASMTKNADVTVRSSTATTLVVESRVTGTVGNFLDTTETLAGGTNSWGAATLASGAGSLETLIDELQAGFQLNSAIQAALAAAEA